MPWINGGPIAFACFGAVEISLFGDPATTQSRNSPGLRGASLWSGGGGHPLSLVELLHAFLLLLPDTRILTVALTYTCRADRRKPA